MICEAGKRLLVFFREQYEQTDRHAATADDTSRGGRAGLGRR